MKTAKYLLFISFLWLSVPVMQAQEEKSSPRIEQLEKQKEAIVAEEKAALKKRVEEINQQLEDREISTSEANRLKEEAAEKHARNIESRLAVIDNEIEWLAGNNGNEIHRPAGDDEVITKRDRQERRKIVNDRTSTQIVVAVGFNNVLEEGGTLEDSDFKIAGSRFFEIGMAWRTQVFTNSNFLRLRYGFSFQFNGLKPTDNRYFVEDGDLTVLEVFPEELDKSKFRMDNLVFPLHFEFGGSERTNTDWGTWFSSREKFRIGLGGFVGLNIGERQKLKYELNGDNVKRKMTNDFNTNDLIYGLSAYLGWGGTTLYGKYDLNPIFDDPNVKLYNVSVGLRFDIE